MQKKFWNRMTSLKFQLLYLNEYIAQSFKYDNYINIFIALSSSSSIAAWVIWSSFKFIWSIIIAVSQVITVLKNYLPYSKRLKFLPQLHSELTDLFNEYDYLWFKVSNGDMTEEEINEKLKTLMIKDTKIRNKYILNNHLPHNKKASNIAQIKFEQYFNEYLN
jgi:hypothetical protein